MVVLAAIGILVVIGLLLFLVISFGIVVYHKFTDKEDSEENDSKC